MKKLEDVIEILKALEKDDEDMSAETQQEEESNRIVIEFGEASEDTGYVGIHLEDVDTFQIALGTASLLSSLIDKCKKGKEDELILLVLALAAKFSADNKPKKKAKE